MERSTVKTKQPLLISFSGLDGSGKSTQIENLQERLTLAGLNVKVLAFWDDVVVGKKYREGFVHKVYQSEKGIGAPGKPVNRRDKNIRAWYLTTIRHFLYMLDAMNLGRVLRRAFKSGPNVVIMDRYIYDELANLPLQATVARAFIKIVRKLAPEPDLAYLLDTDVEAAHARKPEYPVDFMHKCRAAYFRLAQILETQVVIPPLSLSEATEAVVTACDKVILARELGIDPEKLGIERKIGAPAA
jgi:thymidylate kinase